MVYYVFDLDQTLVGDIGPFNKYLEQLEAQRINTSSRNIYTIFVQKIANQEASNNPIGLLRPGILSFMKQISDEKTKGLCQGAVIYSNNSYLKNLEFVRDVIEMVLGKTLFCACIERHHPTRPGPDKTNNPPKTFDELKNILLNEKACNANETLEPKDIVFFDDIHDHQLRKELPKTNYNHVEAYTKKPNLSMIHTLYNQALLEIKQIGGRFNYTYKNRLKQKKEQRKRRYQQKKSKKNKRSTNRI
jgi:hypothetical protein